MTKNVVMLQLPDDLNTLRGGNLGSFMTYLQN